MDKTYLQEIIDYCAKIRQKLSENDDCVALIRNVNPKEITDNERENTLERNLFDYEYVDNTTDEATLYVWIEAEVPRVINRVIKDVDIFITVACHKQYMKLDQEKFSGAMGNRRDELVCKIDMLLNGSADFGIGKLSLTSVRSITLPNKDFTARLISYKVPDFNRRGVGGSGV